MKSEVKKTEYLGGPAEILIAKDRSVRIKLHLDDERTGRKEVRQFELGPKDVLCGIPSAGEWFVSMSKKGDKLYSVSPVQNKDYPLRFTEFWHSGDNPPKPVNDPGGPKEWTDENGKFHRVVFDPSQKFGYIAVVTRGPSKGATGRGSLPYAFETDEDGFAKIVGYKSQEEALKQAFRLWLGEDGYAALEVPFSDNILPDLEPILKDAAYDHEFMGGIKRGFIGRELKPLPDLDEKPTKNGKVKNLSAPKKAPKAKKEEQAEIQF